MITVEAMSHKIERKGSDIDDQKKTESTIIRRRFTTGKKVKLQKGDKGRNREGRIKREKWEGREERKEQVGRDGEIGRRKQR